MDRGVRGDDRRVMKRHEIDARRVYVAGLSAGGAMASVLGAAYLKIFAALGVHLGLPRGRPTRRRTPEKWDDAVRCCATP